MEHDEVSLRESEERFRGTFDNAAVGIAHVALDGRWLRVNDKLCQITGYPRERLVQLTFQDITYPDDLEPDMAFVHQMIAGAIPTYSMEKRYIRGDGALVWINLTVALSRFPSGEPAYFISVIEDIDRRKQAEAALRESESRFRTLADNMSQLAWMADAGGARFWFNRRWIDYTGMASDGANDTGVEIDRSEAEYQRRIAAGEAWTETHRLVGKDGSHGWFLTQVVPLRDASGSIYRWFGTSTDITLQREAERTRERARFFELSLDLVCSASRDGRFVQVNPAFLSILGYLPHELVGSSIDDLLHPDDRGAMQSELAQLAQGRPSIEFTNRCRCKDGRYRWLHWRAVPSGDGMVYAVARDVTEHHRATLALHEKQASLAASLKEREVLLQEVHHRVKNNLQVISSLINMQVRQLQSDAALEALTECKSRVEAIALIHEKLYQTTDYANVPFGEYAKDLVTSVFRTSRSATASVALVLDIGDDIALPVSRAIPCGLILNELITNAMKHAFPVGRQGSIRVELRRDRGDLLLAVSDDGVGMPAELDIRTSKSLGMHLVMMLVRQLKGQISIGREGGTAFRVSCAIDPAQRDRASVGDSPAALP
jgi:PAS domain S-box-containing protein